MLLILALYMILASTFTIGKAALQYVQPIFFIGVRMITGGTLLYGYLHLFKKRYLKFVLKDWYLFAQIILFHIYGAYVLEYLALEHVSSAKACLIYNLSPFITALFSYFFFAERLSVKKWLGLFIGFVGFVPILLAHSTAEGKTFLSFSRAELLLIGSVIASVQGWMTMKRLMHQEHYSPILVNAVGMIGGGILALITSGIFETGPRIFDKPNALSMVIIYMIIAIITANILFYNLYSYLMRYYTTTFLSFAGFTCPLFAALYGHFFLRETIPAAFFSSVILVALGLYIFYRQE